MPNNFILELKYSFQFGAKPKLKFSFDGRIECEILEIETSKKLSYSWAGAMSKNNPSLNSILTFSLEPLPHGTILTLEHKGFNHLKNYLPYIIMKKGWIKIMRRLQNLCEQ